MVCFNNRTLVILSAAKDLDSSSPSAPQNDTSRFDNFQEGSVRSAIGDTNI
jgi:hypothetical protein